MKRNPLLWLRLSFVLIVFVITLPSNANPFILTDTTESGSGPYLRLNEINAHAARDFIKKFPAVTHDKWLKIDGGFMAKFTADNLETHVYYDDRGRFVAIARTYPDINIPAEVKSQVNVAFPDYQIVVATHVITETRSFYRINIKNPESVKTLRITSSKIDVVEDLKNGEPQP